MAKTRFYKKPIDQWTTQDVRDHLLDTRVAAWPLIRQAFGWDGKSVNRAASIAIDALASQEVGPGHKGCIPPFNEARLLAELVMRDEDQELFFPGRFQRGHRPQWLTDEMLTSGRNRKLFGGKALSLYQACLRLAWRNHNTTPKRGMSRKRRAKRSIVLQQSARYLGESATKRLFSALERNKIKPSREEAPNALSPRPVVLILKAVNSLQCRALADHMQCNVESSAPKHKTVVLQNKAIYWIPVGRQNATSTSTKSSLTRSVQKLMEYTSSAIGYLDAPCSRMAV